MLRYHYIQNVEDESQIRVYKISKESYENLKKISGSVSGTAEDAEALAK